MKPYVYVFVLMLGISAAYLSLDRSGPQLPLAQSSDPAQLVGKKEAYVTDSKIKPKPDFIEKQSEDTATASSTPSLTCLETCLDAILSALISGDSLTHSQKLLVTSNPEFLVHYLQYNPKHTVDIGHFITGHMSKSLDDIDYDEALEDRVDILESIITLVPADYLERMASTLIYSSETSQRLTGLKLLEKAYIDRPETEMQGIKANMAETLRNLATSETDPKLQLQAIDILSYESPEEVDEQTILVLTNLSTGDYSVEVKSEALIAAAYYATPESAVISQIQWELNNPVSRMQSASLKALGRIYSHTGVDDVSMRARLYQLKPALEEYMRREHANKDAVDLADSLHEEYFVDR